MTGIKRRSPTNKEFKTKFEGLASTRTKKGHLNAQERKPGDTVVEKGILIRIDRQKLYEDGWEVKVGTGKSAKVYKCSYGDGVMYIPDSDVTKQYFVPKGKVEVELTIDKKTKLYTITKINTGNKTAVALFENLLTLSVDTNENSNVKTSIEVSDESINMKSDSVIITDSDNNEIDLLEANESVKKQIKYLTEQSNEKQTQIQELTNKVNEKEEKIQNLMQRVQILEENNGE